MSDLISRQAAVDALADYIHNVDRVIGTGHLSADDCKDAAISVLADLPSAQPERKRGKWIRHDEVRNVYGGTYVECSECGEKYVVQYIEDEKYCRNCGADMKGEQNE